jgi:hypothetical protein
MPESNGPEEFIRYVDGSLRDGLLTEQEWSVTLDSAASFGLSVTEAEHQVIQRCIEQGAVIEHFEVQKLRELREIAAPDRVLDSATRALLKRILEERYRHARLPNLQTHLDGLLADLSTKARVWEEEPLKQKIGERLNTEAGLGRRVGKEAWRRIYHETLKEIGASEGGAPDLVSLFFDCRRELGIVIAEPEPPAPPPLPPINELTREREAGKVEVSDGPPARRLSALRSFAMVVLISLLVAVFVFFALMLISGRGGAEKGVGGVEIQPLDNTSTAQLGDWIGALQRTPSPMDENVPALLEKIWETCNRYLSLPDRNEAEKENRNWALCRDAVIIRTYEERARKADSREACTDLARCLAFAPQNASCGKTQNRLGCP